MAVLFNPVSETVYQHTREQTYFTTWHILNAMYWTIYETCCRYKMSTYVKIYVTGLQTIFWSRTLSIKITQNKKTSLTSNTWYQPRSQLGLKSHLLGTKEIVLEWTCTLLTSIPLISLNHCNKCFYNNHGMSACQSLPREIRILWALSCLTNTNMVLLVRNVWTSGQLLNVNSSFKSRNMENLIFFWSKRPHFWVVLQRNSCPK